MKIQFLNGGLANQAFQYIFARYYELSHPGDVWKKACGQYNCQRIVNKCLILG